MGNEKSALSGLKADEEALEMTDFWIHYNAKTNHPNLQNISLFVSDPSLHYSASFGKPSPLERAAKNLMIYRHPCIVKYISSWKKSNKFYLATEEVRPLVQIIETQSTLQICIGLHRILRALIFLHQKALATHNNVCKNTIYVTLDGCWKLGGLEHLCKFDDANLQFFQKIQNSRYKNAISPEENITVLKTNGNPDAIDGFAFGVLAEEVLKLKKTDDVPGLNEFKDFLKEQLQHPDPSKRCKLDVILQHSFFTHDFIKIYFFLEELPVKSDVEKHEFFSNLIKQLRTFPEHTVAEQLGRLLLSRLVLINPTAQIKLLPFILKPRDESDVEGNNLFTIPTFKNHLIPKLLQIFCIRDASIRLLLLSYLEYFVHMFQTTELRSQILPELLVGIKDTNDHIVCATLKALANVVPILGAATVIGGNRRKLFTDGRPFRTEDNDHHNRHDKIDSHVVFSESIPELNVHIDTIQVNLAERPSPDGGEDRKESTFPFVEEESGWSDWDVPEKSESPPQPSSTDDPFDSNESQDIIPVDDSIVVETNPVKEFNVIPKLKDRKQICISDISELDIKHSPSMKTTKDDIDFFSDMEPIINKTQVLNIEPLQLTSSSNSKFNVKMSEESVNNSAWCEELSDWETE